MSTATIYNRNGWLLISHNNGAAYTLRQFRPAGSYSVYLRHGDDADAFREEFDACEAQDIDPAKHLFGDYSDVMERD